MELEEKISLAGLTAVVSALAVLYAYRGIKVPSDSLWRNVFTAHGEAAVQPEPSETEP